MKIHKSATSTRQHGCIGTLLKWKFRWFLFLTFLILWVTRQWVQSSLPQDAGSLLMNHHPQEDVVDDPFHRLTNQTSSAACLLVMDDNPRLVEWLAYHYFTMNLRYMVVAIDPRSSTSPQPLLERWHIYDTNFNYVLWHDDDYMGARVLNKRQRLAELGRRDLTTVHRVRQKAFYQFCLEHLEAVGQRGWTLLVDVDEYVVINGEMVPNHHPQEIVSQPGGLLRFIQQQANQAAVTNESNRQPQFASPCVTIPRLLFGTFKDDTHDVDKDYHTLLGDDNHHNNIYLDTQRWLYHAHYQEFDRNGLAKTILDLRRIEIPKPHFPHPVNPHRPFQFCRDPKRIDLHSTALLRVHHYLSTWPTYSFRNDSRKGGERSREAWEFRALSREGGKTMDAVPWLAGFIQAHGMDTTTELLSGAGLSEDYTHPPQVNDQWNFLFTQDFFDPNNPQSTSKFGRFLQNRTKVLGNQVAEDSKGE